MLQLDKSVLENYDDAIRNEWLETNGLGGWSSSSVIGCNTRRYHGLLVAATVPPTERMALVSKLDETIFTSDGNFDLSTNNYGEVIHPKGHQYLTLFTKKIFPEFIYDAGGITLKKTIAMIHGENTTVIIYDVIKARDSFTLELLPLLSIRGYHDMMHANQFINHNALFADDVFQTKAYKEVPDIFIKVPHGRYHAAPQWFYNFNYSVEQYRGLDFTEDLFSHGTFSVELKEGDTLGIIISTRDPKERNALELYQQETARREALIQPGSNEIIRELTLAADQFIVNRGPGLKTIIAGYHWFTDWGRDTMISLPGLTLITGRHGDAKKIISAFAKNVSMGMLPNRFPDHGEAPEYNTVDATLWYFIAIYKYLQATNDTDFILHEILPVLKEIIDWHFKGTRYNIHVDDDGLLYAGETGRQLTWMDAKINNRVVTPRMGKPVEIQALWYNALKIFSELLGLNQQPADAANVNMIAEKTMQSFGGKFWYEEGDYLYDVIDENGSSNNQVRPNQLFAISLPFALMQGEQAQAVLKIVEMELYTPAGLRSLSKNDIDYVAVYGGDTWHRDSAYHQGTVWSWLLGAYIDGIMKVKDKEGKAAAKKIIDDFTCHLNEACIGSVSEIFDGDPPHHPRGCIAQAWGVAEILRVIEEYELYGVEKKEN